MTDRRNNPNEPPDDDWAMSESESDLSKGDDLEIEFPAEEKEEEPPENVSNLYDPLETGDLEGWDISDEAEAPFAPEVPINQAPQGFNQSPPTFQTPQNTIEIIEPEKPHIPPDNWEMKSAPPQDGWKMPEPQFRTTGGRAKQVTAGDASAQVAESTGKSEETDEALSDIYLPPDTQDPFADISESPDLPSLDAESFTTEDLKTEDLSEMKEAVTSFEEKPQGVPAKKGKRKAFIFFAIVFLLVSFFVIGLLGVAYFFYFDQLRGIFGN
jgi:hypothetical protein